MRNGRYITGGETVFQLEDARPVATNTVLFVVSEWPGVTASGGIGTATSALVAALRRRGVMVEVIVVTSTPLSWNDRDAKVVLIDPDIRPSSHAAPATVLRYVESRRPDVIVCQDYLGLGAFLPGSRACGGLSRGTRIITYAHGPNRWARQSSGIPLRSVVEWETEVCERVALEGSDVVVSPSNYMLDWLSCNGYALPSRSHCIPLIVGDQQDAHAAAGSSCDQDSRPPQSRGSLTKGLPAKSSSKPVVAFFGRLEHRKGILEFVQAVEILVASGQDIDVLLLGADSHESSSAIASQLRSFASQRGVNLTVTTHTAKSGQEARAKLLDAGALAVVPSRIDNSPSVIYECALSGIPLVSTCVGGIPEILEYREGQLVTPTAQALAQAIAGALRAWQEDGSFAGSIPTLASDPTASLDAWLDLLSPVSQVSLEGEDASNSDLQEVSVVITTRDRPLLAEEAIMSVLAQSVPAHEVVVVDDGSSDANRARLQRFAMRLNVRVIFQDNSYLGAARNRGLQETSSEWILFLDDDDTLVPTALEDLLSAAFASGADAVTSWSYLVQDHLAEVPSVWAFLGDVGSASLVRNLVGSSAGLIRRSALESVGGFTTDWAPYEDWDLYVRMLSKGAKIVGLPKPLLRYRVSDTGMLRTASAAQGRFRVSRGWLSGAPTAGLSDVAAALELSELVGPETDSARGTWSDLAYLYWRLQKWPVVGSLARGSVRLMRKRVAHSKAKRSR